MIKNERQYRITRAEAKKFEQLIKELEPSDQRDKADTALREAELAGLRSQLSDLHSELREYDDLRSGKHILLESESLEQLPRALVKARIAAGISQKELAGRLSLKEQQIQRYEATDYAGASIARLAEIANALGLRFRKSFFVTSSAGPTFDVFAKLKQMGLDRDFVLRRFLPHSITEKAKANTLAKDADVVFHAADVVSHIYGWTPEAIIGTQQLFVDQGVLGAARFKVAANAEQRRLSAYTFYAHFLALLLLEATADLAQKPIPTDFRVIRSAVLKHHGEMSLHNVLNYIWDLGIPVLPLNDPGAFHGATWRVEGRNVIVLKQQTSAMARWLHDALHELFHTGRESEKKERAIIEEAETSAERRLSDEEWDATQFAADVVLDGRAEELAKRCVDATKNRSGGSGSVERLKFVVPDVATREGVPTDSLANYLAFRLSLQDIDWWGAAQNLQNTKDNPWMVARDILLERAKLDRIGGLNRELLIRALSDTEDTESKS